MAIKAVIRTEHGEDRECYIRIIDVHASNHGVASHALFRAFVSEQAFRDGSKYVWEREVEFYPDVALPIWPQAYEVLKALDEIPEEAQSA